MRDTESENDNGSAELGVEFADDDFEDDPRVRFDTSRIREAALSSSDWTTETIVSQLRRNNIELNPRFQRRDAWTRTNKSRFVESVILGFPIPQIVLAERKLERGRFIVLDGKQRLLSLLQFFGRDDEDPKTLKLAGLEVRSDLNGSTIRQLRSDPGLTADLNQLLNHTIRAVVIRNWPDNEFLHEVFLRLNTGSVRLSPQELRQALYPGEFLSFVSDWTLKDDSVRSLMNLRDPDFRMRDVELALRYIAMRMFLGEYRGNLRLFLDGTCSRLDANWPTAQTRVERVVQELRATIDVAKSIFGVKHVGRRWEGSKYQSRFNRAVYDAQMISLADERVRAAVPGREHEIELAFRKLCESDEEFISSIESTTKSLGATFTRLQRWSETLSVTLRVPIEVRGLESIQSRINGS